MGDLRLHLDPRRKDDNYAGTGYLGVDIAYVDGRQPGGGGPERPYTVKFDGQYAGRFATTEQAAVHFARLEAGLPAVACVTDEPESPSGKGWGVLA